MLDHLKIASKVLIEFGTLLLLLASASVLSTMNSLHSKAAIG